MKLGQTELNNLLDEVAPRMGAWIETGAGRRADGGG